MEGNTSCIIKVIKGHKIKAEFSILISTVVESNRLMQDTWRTCQGSIYISEPRAELLLLFHQRAF